MKLAVVSMFCLSIFKLILASKVFSSYRKLISIPFLEKVFTIFSRICVVHTLWRNVKMFKLEGGQRGWQKDSCKTKLLFCGYLLILA